MPGGIFDLKHKNCVEHIWPILAVNNQLIFHLLIYHLWKYREKPFL